MKPKTIASAPQNGRVQDTSFWDLVDQTLTDLYRRRADLQKQIAALENGRRSGTIGAFKKSAKSSGSE